MGKIQNLVFSFVVTVTMIGFVKCQFFDPILDDKTYLDNIQKDVLSEVEETKAELVDQARVVENVTRAYIAAKLKENVFKALRVIAENELTKVSIIQAQRPKSPKQESEDEDGDDENTQKPTTPLTGLGTAVKVNQQVFSFLGEAFKIIFAGGKPKKYVDKAEVLMSKPADVQILGVVSLLARGDEDKEVSAPVDDSANKLPVYPGYYQPVRPNNKGTKKGSGENQDDDVVVDYESGVTSQDARIIDLFSLLGFGSRKSAGGATAKKNETLSGFDEETTKAKPQRFSFDGFVKNFRKSIKELNTNVPDIYRGVQEAYKLLDTVRGVAARLEEFVSDIF